MKFSDWLLHEINKRDWSQSDLARQSGLTRQAVSHLISGRSKTPDNETIEKLARAFDVTIEAVMRHAQILPSIAEPDAKKQELEYLLSRVSDSVLDDVLEFTRFITRRKQNDKKGKD